MEEKSTSVFKISLNYGLITGFLLVLLELVFYLLEIEQESSIKYVAYLVFLGGIIWASKVYRDNYSDGFITYGKAFTVGLLVGLIAAVIAAIFMYVFLSYIDPSVLTQQLEVAEQRLLESGEMTDEQIDNTLAMTERFMTPAISSIGIFIWNALIVTIMSLVTSIFIKKE